jgi:hypothetical protein
MDFETKMRQIIMAYVEPALKLSIEDRETNIDLDILCNKLAIRNDLLE